jgi:hypothetical protein
MNTLWMIGIVFLSVGNLRSAVVLGEDSTAAPAITPIGGVWRGSAPLRDSKIGEKDMAEMAYGMGWVSLCRAQTCLLTWVAWHRSLRAVPVGASARYEIATWEHACVHSCTLLGDAF